MEILQWKGRKMMKSEKRLERFNSRNNNNKNKNLKLQYKDSDVLVIVASFEGR